MGRWQIAGFLEAKHGTLHVDGVSAVDLAREHGTPLFVISERRLRQNAADILQAFSRPPFQARVFYASKANSNQAVLQVVRAAGLNAEVNSGGELFKARQAGFRPEQIIYNGVAKSEAELAAAIAEGIFCLNVDSAFELERIVDIAGRLGRRANIALRMVPEVETGTHAGLETGTWEKKFGIARAQLLDCYKAALRRPEQVALIGLHMHVGAQTVQLDKFTAAFQSLVRHAAELQADTGHRLQHLNLGGGLPVAFIKEGDDQLKQMMASDPAQPVGDMYGLYRAGPTPGQVAEATLGQLTNAAFLRELDEICSGFAAQLPELTYLLEPGTRVVADAAVLLTTVQNFKTRHPSTDTWLLLDAGFNVLLDVYAYKWYFHALAAGRADAPADTPYKLGGPLCDGGDEYHDCDGLQRLPPYRLLPAGMRPGDLIAFLDVGGYTLEQMSQYNGQPRPAAVLIRPDGARPVVRRRETYEDLISLDNPLPADPAAAGGQDPR